MKAFFRLVLNKAARLVEQDLRQQPTYSFQLTAQDCWQAVERREAELKTQFAHAAALEQKKAELHTAHSRPF